MEQRENILKDIVRKSYEVRSNALTEAKKENDQFQPPPPPPAVAAPSPSAVGAGASRASGATTGGSVLKVRVVQLMKLFSDVGIGDYFYACPDDFPSLSKYEGEERTYGVKVLSAQTYDRFQTNAKADAAKVADPTLKEPVKVSKDEEVPSKGVEVEIDPKKEGGFIVKKDDELKELDLPSEKIEEVEEVSDSEDLGCTQTQNYYQKVAALTVKLVKQNNEAIRGPRVKAS